MLTSDDRDHLYSTLKFKVLRSMLIGNIREDMRKTRISFRPALKSCAQLQEVRLQLWSWCYNDQILIFLWNTPKLADRFFRDNFMSPVPSVFSIIVSKFTLYKYTQICNGLDWVEIKIIIIIMVMIIQGIEVESALITPHM